MIRACLLLAVSIAFPPSAQAKEHLDEDECLQAISQFRSRPLSEAGEGAAALIVKFAEHSDTVTVNIEERLIPWVGNVSHSETLLAAFIAGNLRSQLETGINRSDPYSGLLMVISVYRQLQAKKANLQIEALENLVALHEKGMLASFAFQKN